MYKCLLYTLREHSRIDFSAETRSRKLCQPQTEWRLKRDEAVRRGDEDVEKAAGGAHCGSGGDRMKETIDLLTG